LTQNVFSGIYTIEKKVFQLKSVLFSLSSVSTNIFILQQCLDRNPNPNPNFFVEFGSSQNILSCVKCHVGKMSCQEFTAIVHCKIMLIKPTHLPRLFQMSCWLNVMSAKRYDGELSVGECSCWQNAMLANCHVGEMSCWRNVMLANCHVGKLFCWWFVLLAKCHVGVFHVTTI
jgi:hypothetical protein